MCVPTGFMKLGPVVYWEFKPISLLLSSRFCILLVFLFLLPALFPLGLYTDFVITYNLILDNVPLQATANLTFYSKHYLTFIQVTYMFFLALSLKFLDKDVERVGFIVHKMSHVCFNESDWYYALSENSQFVLTEVDYRQGSLEKHKKCMHCMHVENFELNLST